MRYIDPTTDYGFKRLFSDEAILRSCLNAILPTEDAVRSLEYVNQEVLGDNPEGRVVIFDLHCTTRDGRTIIVEMQRLPQPYYKRRMLYYAMRGFEHHVRRGASEYELQPVYIVSIVDFELPGSYEGFAHRFLLRGERGELFSEVLQLYFVELPKFEMTQLADKPELTTLEQWAAALKEMPALDGIPDWVTDEDLRRAFEVSEVANLSAEERSKFERALRDDRDFRGQVLQQYIYGKMRGLREGREEGREMGRDEGREEGKRDLVAALHRNGQSVEQIATLTDLPLEVVLAYVAAGAE